MKISPKILLYLLIICLFIVASYNSNAARVKDIAIIEGAGEVQVIGYGLVTGLNNSGDNQQSTFTIQSISNMLKRFGLTIPQRNPRIRNVAAVMVTANISSFMKKGSKVDVTVSSIGDANSLQGGVLLMTPLSTADGAIIGFAQGPLAVGGFDAQAYGSRITRNTATTGRIPNGLILNTDLNSEFINNEQIRIFLRQPDFTTATRISEAINGLAALAGSATANDAATIQVQLPAGQTQQEAMQLITQIEALNIITDPVARIVINERTGTVVVGGNVELLPAVIAHSGLEIMIQKQVLVPQPAPFTIRPPSYRGFETAEIEAEEELNDARPLVVQGATVADIAEALNLLEVSPRDLIAIFQALKQAGSIQGELVIQ
jgi:flagellar P-ring protein precursor FlgI